MKRKILVIAFVGIAAVTGIGIAGKSAESNVTSAAEASEKENLIAAEEVENLADAEENFRVSSGTLTEKFYHEDGDYTSMTVETEDGNAWTVENFVAPIGTECEVTFDTCGTENLTDDVIVSITTYTTFE